MKALTVQQPWASLLLGIAPAASPTCAPGVKDIENRKWSTDYRGPLLIHSAKGFDVEAMNSLYDGVPDDRFPRGCMLGLVNLDGMVPPGRDCGSPWGTREQWNWRVSRPRVFSRFISLRGQLGLWECDEPMVVSLANAATNSSTRWWDSLSEGDREWFIERVGILEYQANFGRLAAVQTAYALYIVNKYGQAQPEETHHDHIPYFGVSESWWHNWDAAHAQ